MRGHILQGRTKTSTANSMLKREAVRIYQEYQLNEAGVTYAQLGYLTPEGYLPAWKVAEHLICSMFVTQAQADAMKQARR